MKTNILKWSFVFFLIPLMTYSQLKNVDYWEQRFIKKSQKKHMYAERLSQSVDSRKFYDLAYYIDADVAIYKATGKTKYIDCAIEYINNMIDSAKKSADLPKSQYKDDYYGWSNLSASKSNNLGKEVPLYESYIWRYVTDLLYVMKKDHLDQNADFMDEYQKILDFTKINIYEKWHTRGKKNLYRSRTHMMSHWVKISMNLFLLTDNDKYKEIIDDFLVKFRGNKEFSASRKGSVSLKWKSAWKKESQKKYQDVSHGNAVIDVMISLYEHNLGVNKEEIDNFVELFDKTVWKSKNSYATYVDGSGKGSGWFTDGWIKLGRFNEDLQKRIENHTKGRSVQFFANGALNAKILLGKN